MAFLFRNITEIHGIQRIIGCCIISFASWAAPSLQAGTLPADSYTEPTDTATMLNEVVVTSTKRPLATVQELEGPQLQALSSTSIADALKYFAGVQIKDYGGLGV